MCVKRVLRDSKTEFIIELEKSLYLARTNEQHVLNLSTNGFITSPNQGKSTLPRLAEVFSSYNSKVQFTVT